VEETVEHLFWDCPFAQQCWGLLNLQTIQGASSLQNVEAIKIQLHSQFFMVAVITMLWTIWKARNELIFNNNQIGLQDCRAFFLPGSQTDLPEGERKSIRTL
jgi:hypothetical protein